MFQKLGVSPEVDTAEGGAAGEYFPFIISDILGGVGGDMCYQEPSEIPNQKWVTGNAFNFFSLLNCFKIFLVCGKRRRKKSLDIFLLVIGTHNPSR